MTKQPEPSAAELRDEVSPVSERFAAFELGDAVVVYEDGHSERWICSDTAWDRDEVR